MRSPKPRERTYDRAFDERDLERLDVCLSGLLPHVDPARIALTGGVAVQIHLWHGGQAAGVRVIADLDFVAADVDAVGGSAATELLVSHFHLPQPGYPKFMIQLVDPVSRLRIDVFPDLDATIARARLRKIAGHELAVLDAGSILDHKLRTLATATVDRPVDAKHWDDARALAAVCGRELGPVSKAVLTRERYVKDLTPCSRCEASRCREFPVASREAIFDILGYN